MLGVTLPSALSVKVILQITWWNFLDTSTYIALIRLKVNRKPSDDVPLCRGDIGSNPVVGIARRQIPLNSHLRFKSNFFISTTRGISFTPC